jgi:hypothetical protein
VKSSADRSPLDVWILDGHNLIYAVPSLAVRQEKGDGRGARDAVVLGAQRFGARRRVRMVVVFDGARGGEDGERAGGVEILYASGEGGADDRIVRRAEALTERGARVTVVTRDRALRARLPGRARTEDPVAFWDSIPGRRRPGPSPEPTTGEKPVFSAPDIEEHFLARERESRARERERRARREASSRRGGGRRPGRK